MQNNKLYGAAMLNDEIGGLLKKVHSLKDVAKDMLIYNSSEISETQALDIMVKALVIQRELNGIAKELQRLNDYANEYYSGGEKFFMDVISLMQDALANNGKISSKRLLGIMGKAPNPNIECSVQFGRC